jgi:hypothetical protein
MVVILYIRAGAIARGRSTFRKGKRLYLHEHVIMNKGGDAPFVYAR